jgi:hypothetical protein
MRDASRELCIFAKQILCENQNSCYTLTHSPDRIRAPARGLAARTKEETGIFLFFPLQPIEKSRFAKAKGDYNLDKAISMRYEWRHRRLSDVRHPSKPDLHRQ